MKLHQSITLADGRRLSYADIGHPDHHAVFYFHGFPGSRLEAAYAEQIILRCQVRVIAVERPGYGQSTHDPDRSITDWPHDIAQLADSLGLKKFSLLGVSAGGVYALACSNALGDRIHRTGISGCLAPLHEPGIMREMNWLSRYVLRQMGKNSALAEFMVSQVLGRLFRRFPAQVIKSLQPSLCKRDVLAFRDRHFRTEFIKSIREAYRNGLQGPFLDLALITKAWGFEPEEIKGRVYLWHGKRDSIVPQSMGSYLELRLRNCSSHFPEEEGHFSIISNNMEQALLTLKAGQSEILHQMDTLHQQIRGAEFELELEV